MDEHRGSWKALWCANSPAARADKANYKY